MSYYPTGMSPVTGNHYHNVAAQMQAYLNNGSGYSQSGSSGLHQYQRPHGFHSGAQYHNTNRMMNGDPDALARSFMRTLFA
ncbi:unnamed protein product [Rotaria sp. Silwood2]|nr:unnamed protein product [Rotaria sp. Silwood2]CAF2868631.1 unnamed protein product [Rotaria sp. Silwood2]CAF4159595.1 unnamed protein product [Rotaria sp. Silwood2]CAF4236125.1 unnamed protein product [Rotaria sp. Silwood2]